MRLIDADAFKECIITCYNESRYLIPKGRRRFAKAVTVGLLRDIDKQPTAYDIDKVIEQLQRQIDQYHRRAREAGLVGCAYESCHNYSKACSCECALKIVRGEQE